MQSDDITGVLVEIEEGVMRCIIRADCAPEDVTDSQEMTTDHKVALATWLRHVASLLEDDVTDVRLH